MKTTQILAHEGHVELRDIPPGTDASTVGMPCRDSVLVQGALQGDERAFEHLYYRHKDKVLKVCLDFSKGDRAQACDLMQEIFICAFNDLIQLRDGSLFPHWLLRIARNKCVSHLRKKKTLDNVLRDYEVIKPDNDEREWSAEDLQLIEDLIESIEEPEIRRTVKLFYLEGKRTSEIAAILGTSQTAITTRLNRFRSKFRKRIIQDILRLRASKL